MGYKTVFKEVMREYDRDQTRARTLLERRRTEAYEKAPALREIDEEIKGAGFRMAKAVLAGGEDARRLAEEIRARSRFLTGEKERLLAEAGFSPDYFTEVYRCMKCRDTGYLSLEGDGHTAPVVERCPCLRQKLITKYYDLSNLAEVLTNENFDTFDLRYYSEEVDPAAGLSPRENIQGIYRLCSDFVNRFDTVFSNLLFYGNAGLGKTFLCNCVAKDILDKGRTVLYVTAPKIFQILEDYRFNRDEMEEPDETIDAVTEVDLLIIDDLGSEFATVVTSSALFHLINTRLLDKKHTVISTNLSPADFEGQYSERIVSRFFGYYKMLRFIGDDIREMKKYGKRFMA